MFHALLHVKNRLPTLNATPTWLTDTFLHILAMSSCILCFVVVVLHLKKKYMRFCFLNTEAKLLWKRRGYFSLNNNNPEILLLWAHRNLWKKSYSWAKMLTNKSVIREQKHICRSDKKSPESQKSHFLYLLEKNDRYICVFITSTCQLFGQWFFLRYSDHHFNLSNNSILKR